jgi:hypothetical protein
MPIFYSVIPLTEIKPNRAGFGCYRERHQGIYNKKRQFKYQ